MLDESTSASRPVDAHHGWPPRAPPWASPLIPLAKPVAGAWDLLAVSPRGLTRIAAVSEKPNVPGTTYGAVPGWPTDTVRLILVWGDSVLPTAITLS